MHSATLSLGMITECLLSLNPTMGKEIMENVLIKIVNEIGQSLQMIQDRINDKHNKKNL
jgi:hypothetical protein